MSSGVGLPSNASGGKTRMPKVTKVKNKSAAELQITAEQLLREAKERQLEIVPPPPKQKIQDAAELADFQVRAWERREGGTLPEGQDRGKAVALLLL